MAKQSEGEGDDVAAASEALHGASLRGFTAERARLVSELRRSGAREAARAVQRMRRPPAAAWAVNQLHRQARGELDRLLELGRRMRGGDGGAGSERRAVLDRLRARAGELLRDGGQAATPAVLRRIGATLESLSAAGGWAPDRPGQLAADRDPPGFEVLLAGGSVGSARAGAARSSTAAAPARAARPGSAAAASPSRRAARPAIAAVASPSRPAGDDAAAARAEASERTAERERRAEARRRVAEADREVAARRRDAGQAEAALARAQRELDRHRAGLVVAERRLAELSAALAVLDRRR